MADISEHDCIMRLTEGLKMASDACKMLGVMQRNSDFLGISRIIDEISKNAARLATSKAMSEQVLKEGLTKFSTAMSN